MKYIGVGSDCRSQALTLTLPLLLPPVSLWCQSSLKPERLLTFSRIDIYISLLRAKRLSHPHWPPEHPSRSSHPQHCRPPLRFFFPGPWLKDQAGRIPKPFRPEIQSQTSLKSSPLQKLSLKMLPSSILQDRLGVKCLPWKEGCFSLPRDAQPSPWGDPVAGGVFSEGWFLSPPPTQMIPPPSCHPFWDKMEGQ